jgi:hypothetical protein
MKSDRALSEIIATTLIIVLVVILVAIIGGLLAGFINLTEKSAYIAVDISIQTINTKNVIVLFNKAGDTAYLNTASQGQYMMSVWIDNTSGSYRALPLRGVDTFSPGTTLFVYYNRTGGFNITNKNTDIASTSAQPLHPGPISVRLIDESSHVLIANWSTAESGSPYPLPTVISITNTTGYRGWPVIERITGTNFFSGSTSKLNRTGSPDIPATTCTYVSSTQLICTYDLLSKAASPPNYNVVVTNPDGRSGMRANYFTLSSPTPTISTSTPATGAQGATVTIINLAGNYFQSGALVDYYMGGTRINLTGVNVVSPTQITGTLTIPLTAPAGSYGVSVKNTDGITGVRTGRFTVISTTPTITARSPTAGNRGWPVSMTITGTNFVSGSTVKLNRTGYPDIFGTSVVVVSPTQITCTFDLLNAQVGSWNLAVTIPDGRGAVRAAYFTVNSPTPTISTSTPATGVRDTSVSITNLAGTGFQPGALVDYYLSGTRINLTGVNVVSSTQITGTLNIPPSAPAGSYGVSVKNTDGITGVRTGRFAITNPPPTVAAISPVQGRDGMVISPVVVTGTNFLTGAQVRLYRGAILIYTAPAGTVTSTQITTSFNIPEAVVVGVTDVRVTNTDALYGTLPNGYTILE